MERLSGISLAWKDKYSQDGGGTKSRDDVTNNNNNMVNNIPINSNGLSHHTGLQRTKFASAVDATNNHNNLATNSNLQNNYASTNLPTSAPPHKLTSKSPKEEEAEDEEEEGEFEERRLNIAKCQRWLEGLPDKFSGMHIVQQTVYSANR